MKKWITTIALSAVILLASVLALGLGLPDGDAQADRQQQQSVVYDQEHSSLLPNVGVMALEHLTLETSAASCQSCPAGVYEPVATYPDADGNAVVLFQGMRRGLSVKEITLKWDGQVLGTFGAPRARGVGHIYDVTMTFTSASNYSVGIFTERQIWYCGPNRPECHAGLDYNVPAVLGECPSHTYFKPPDGPVQCVQ